MRTKKQRRMSFPPKIFHDSTPRDLLNRRILRWNYREPHDLGKFYNYKGNTYQIIRIIETKSGYLTVEVMNIFGNIRRNSMTIASYLDKKLISTHKNALKELKLGLK